MKRRKFKSLRELKATLRKLGLTMQLEPSHLGRRMLLLTVSRSGVPFYVGAGRDVRALLTEAVALALK